ncbi:MAG: ABC transporter ATP-binding protein [Chitinophagales bacterium]
METVVLKNIVKHYGKKKNAVNDVSFSVEEGELFGLIGPDGAGKTTLFRILTTLLIPDSGTARVCDFNSVKDYKQIRNIVGYMPGRFSLYQDLSVEENLNFFATVFNTTIEKNYELVKDIYVQLEPFKKRRAGKLSGGMKQKLALCCALIHKPRVLFLDEPTTGVDAVSRKEFWEMLKRLKDQHITILVSTPYMDEANLCDRVALMQNGKMFSIDTPANITASYSDDLYSMKADNMFELMKVMREFPQTERYLTFGDCAHVSFKEKIANENEVTDFAMKNGLHEVEFKKISPTIEDAFIKFLS